MMKRTAQILLATTAVAFSSNCGRGLCNISWTSASCALSRIFPTSISVERVYANNNTEDSLSWNYYADGDTTTSDCNPATSNYCYHGGSARKITLDGVSSCDGLSAADSEGVFRWECQLVGGIATFFTRGFQIEKGLRQLVNAANWKSLSVTINHSGGFSASTQPSTWWSNTVEPAPVPVTPLNTKGTIYTWDSSTPTNGYSIEADQVSLVTLEGSTMIYDQSTTDNCNTSNGETGSANNECLITSGSEDFIWIETHLDGMERETNGVDRAVILFGSRFSRIHSTRIGDTEVRSLLLSNSNQVHLSQVYLAKASQSAFDMDTNTNTKMSQVFVHNCNSNGFLHSSATDRVATQVVVHGCQTAYRTSESGVVVGATLVESQSSGLPINGQDDTTNASLLLANNGGSSISVISGLSDNNTFYDVSIVAGVTGFQQTATATATNFYGELLMGGLTTQCLVTAGTANITTTGNCVESDPDLDLQSGMDPTNTFSGFVTDGDSANSHSTAIDAGNGFVALASITDFFRSSSFFRGWGQGASTTFLNSSNRFICSTTCGFSDWRLATGDTGDPRNGGQPLALNQLACPSGSDTGTHTWDDTSTTTFLQRAFEILGDATGNENGLCENNERCLYTPNIGAYQGHGEIVASNTLSTGCSDIGSGGTIENVQLMQYAENGI